MTPVSLHSEPLSPLHFVLHDDLSLRRSEPEENVSPARIALWHLPHGLAPLTLGMMIAAFGSRNSEIPAYLHFGSKADIRIQISESAFLLKADMLGAVGRVGGVRRAVERSQYPYEAKKKPQHCGEPR